MKEEVSELRERIISIDALRGLAMFLILSTQIGGAPIFKSLGDMIWPQGWPDFWANQMSWANPRVSFLNIAQSIFIFIVGVVLPFSLNNKKKKMEKSKLYLFIIKRSIILYILGLMAGAVIMNLPATHKTLANFPAYNNVLEYIAVAYQISSFIVLNTTVKTQYIITGSLLLLFWFIWLFIPAPGSTGDIFSSQMNIGFYIDSIILGNHGHFGTTKVLNSVNNVTIVMIGVLAGHLIFSNLSKSEKAKRLFIAGASMMIFGKIWSIFFPILRDYNSSTFVLVSVGFAVLLLALFYFIIDIKGYSGWAFFFIVFGVNSIAIYMMAHLFDFRLIGNVVVGGISSLFSQQAGDFIRAVTAMIVMWLIVYYMYTKRTFIKI
jgi:predicted acyltransferase